MMKSIVIYYSFGGATEREAQRLAAELACPLVKAEETKPRNLFSAFFPGCPQARHRKASEIKPLSQDLSDYDRIVIGAPIWAGHPAPAFNAIVNQLPPGKAVSLFLCSGGGERQKSEAGTRKLIEAKGCQVAEYRDIKTSQAPSKMK